MSLVTYSFEKKLPALTASLVSAVDAVTGWLNSGSSFYLWIQGRNKSGYSLLSDVTTLTLPTNASFSKIRIPLTQLNTLRAKYADWREVIITLGTTNNITNARVVSTISLYESDQKTIRVLSGNLDLYPTLGTYATPNLLPTASLEGERAFVTSLGDVYEYRAADNRAVDNVTVAKANWVVTLTHRLSEPITQLALQYGAGQDIAIQNPIAINTPYPGDSSPGISVTYLVFNNTGVAVPTGTRIELNGRINNKPTTGLFTAILRGYATFSELDVLTITRSGLVGIDVPIQYDGTNNIFLPASLAANSAAILEMFPYFSKASLTGFYAGLSSLTLYPEFAIYGSLDGLTLPWDNSVADLISLSSVSVNDLVPSQIRFVNSVKKPFYFDSSSTETANGNTIIALLVSPSVGRWKLLETKPAAGSVTLDSLEPATKEVLEGTIQRQELTATATTVLDGDANDLYIVTLPPAFTAASVVLNVSFNVTGKSNYHRSIMVKVTNSDGLFTISNDYKRPNNLPLTRSTDEKTDLYAFTVDVDSSGVIIKKNVYLLETDV